MEAAREEEEDRERRGVTGRALIWAMDRRQIEEDLVRWYDHEVKDAAGFLPGAFEVSFGPVHYGLGTQDPTYSSDRPLVLDVPGRRLAVQGRIDRIDWDEARAKFRVIDYKTGKARDAAAFDRGRALQLPIYLHAAAQALGMEPAQGMAEYFYVSSRGDFKRK
jgi:ATP-dependent helicase/DNAse subunit B